MSVQAKPSVGVAIASLVCGIIGVILFFIPFIGIFAVVCGHIALSKIKKNPEELGGSGQAIAGLVMGYGQIFIGFFVSVILASIVLPAVGDALNEAKKTKTEITLKYVKEELTKYELTHKEVPSDLSQVEAITADMLTDGWGGTITYRVTGDKSFSLISLGSDGVQSEDDIVVNTSL